MWHASANITHTLVNWTTWRKDINAISSLNDKKQHSHAQLWQCWIWYIKWKPQISTIFNIYVKYYCLQCTHSKEQTLHIRYTDKHYHTTAKTTILFEHKKPKGEKYTRKEDAHTHTHTLPTTLKMKLFLFAKQRQIALHRLRCDAHTTFSVMLWFLLVFSAVIESTIVCMCISKSKVEMRCKEIQ